MIYKYNKEFHYESTSLTLEALQASMEFSR